MLHGFLPWLVETLFQPFYSGGLQGSASTPSAGPGNCLGAGSWGTKRLTLFPPLRAENTVMCSVSPNTQHTVYTASLGSQLRVAVSVAVILLPGCHCTRLGLFLVTTWSPPGKPARGSWAQRAPGSFQALVPNSLEEHGSCPPLGAYAYILIADPGQWCLSL